ncbi:ATP synthase gamma chain [hydrothermal vent metagenome]|uniref:ATP synthase gamma chain n=1 Tax=hydrothermal vent metagenome TaxID=652676 RepID=A0A3B1CKZ1_9ZZZZ
MANLKDIKRRIGSVKNTQQITRAMKLVAAAKLRRAQEAVLAARPYAEKVMEVMEDVAVRVDPEAHPLLHRREGDKKLILVLAGDKGLCGPYNSNIFKAAMAAIGDGTAEDISLALVGGKGADFFKRRPYPVVEKFLDYGKRDVVELAHEVAGVVIKLFVDEEIDQVILIYNKFKNVVIQLPQTVSLIPLTLPSVEENDRPVDFEYEPSAEVVLDGMLRRYIENQIYEAILESAASENGSRMTAMDAATKNAKEMIDDLTLIYNRARQAAITTELIEVVAGADALEG